VTYEQRFEELFDEAEFLVDNLAQQFEVMRGLMRHEGRPTREVHQIDPEFFLGKIDALARTASELRCLDKFHRMKLIK